MSEPLVSIVLPTYNGARYIEQSIESCLGQTHKNWELIIVDDASTDSTPDIAAQLARHDERIRHVRHATNQKLPAALNTGFELARGEYLTWTSDDNRYRPNALAEMVSGLDNCTDADLVYADYTVIDASGASLRNIVCPNYTELVYRNCVGPCFLYRRHVGQEVGQYSTDLFLAEDYDYWLRVSVQFRMVPLHRDLYLYREHSTSLTAMRTEQIQLISSDALRKQLPRLYWLTRYQRARAYLRVAVADHRRGLWPAWSHNLLAAIIHSPNIIFRTDALGLTINLLFGHSAFEHIQRQYWRLRRRHWQHRQSPTS